MKSKLLILSTIFSIVSLLALFSFSVTDYDVKPSTAEVEQVQGLYIFTDAKPIREYEYIGSVKSTMSFSGGQYTAVRDLLIKKAKKDYPEAQALILTLQSGGTDRCDAIKFK